MYGDAGVLSPYLSDFTVQHNADQTWDASPSDVPKELGLLDQRVKDIYPQGKGNCAQFLRECQAKGFSFRIKAKKTSPNWTWYFELANAGGMSGGYSTPGYGAPGNGGAGYNSNQPYGGAMGPLSPNLADFTLQHNADETWDGTPSGVPRELELLDQRVNDIYPQGKGNCAQFMRECQMKGLCFKIKAKKTAPNWTWYYELANAVGMPQPYGGGVGPLSSTLADFAVHYDADETWDGTPSDVLKELRLLKQRENDFFPQGKDKCAQFMRECQIRGLCFKIKVKKTSPYLTWYYELANAGGVGEPYRAIYSFNADKPRQLKFRNGDIIYVHHKDGQWWEGECNGKYGLFPNNYVAKFEGTGELYKALYSFDDHNPGHLTYQRGDFILVHKREGSWWEGECYGRYGPFPSDSVTKFDGKIDDAEDDICIIC